jgi:hypothetical protein
MIRTELARPVSRRAPWRDTRSADSWAAPNSSSLWEVLGALLLVECHGLPRNIYLFRRVGVTTPRPEGRGF